jgi:hypothetical protein
MFMVSVLPLRLVTVPRIQFVRKFFWNTVSVSPVVIDDSLNPGEYPAIATVSVPFATARFSAPLS